MHGKMHVKQKQKTKQKNEKERLIWTYWLMERKTLQKDWPKTTKNFCGALPSWRERKSF